MHLGDHVLNALINVIHVHIICYDAISIHTFKEFLQILTMSLWKSRHVLCTTEFYCQFPNPVVADCTCSTVLVFLVVRVKVKLYLCRVGLRGFELQLHTFFEIG